MERRILIRPTGELALKSKQTRRRFQKRLIECISDALSSAGLEHRIRSEWGRIFIETSGQGGLEDAARVFGIASLSEVEATIEPRLESIIEVGEQLYAERVRGRTFAVRGRRSGRHSFSSKDINYDLGAALDKYGTVDLDSPEVTVGVEVRNDFAYLYSDKVRGVGGLPVGSEGNAIALISGGFDSAVAAWMMLKRGVALDYVFCNLAGSAYERAVLGVAKLMADEWSYGTRPRIHIVDFEEPVRHLKEQVRESYWQVILKRLMYRVGARVARETGALAVVTGEAIGQVSSQTLPNLCAIDASVDIPVIRPLVSFDKSEIIDRSRAIGTYPLSEKVREYCALTENRPVTNATPEDAAAQESTLDLSILYGAIANRRVLDLRALDASDLVMPYLYTTDISPDAVVIDTRTPAMFEAWHYPGANQRDFWDILRDYSSLDRKKTYVLYCDLGLKTAQLAEKMQKAGFEAYSFKGGLRALKEYAEKSNE